MSPSTREPKYAYGRSPIAMPSGWKPLGRARTAGPRSGECAAAGVAASVAPRTAEMTIARERLDTEDPFQAEWGCHRFIPRRGRIGSPCTYSDVRIHWRRHPVPTEG